MSKWVGALLRLITTVVCGLLLGLLPRLAHAQGGPFCDSFDDGSGFLTRWTPYQGYQTPVGSPTHSGDSAIEFHGGCHSSIYRTGFEAGYGEYSVWVNQQHSMAHFSVYIQFARGANPDPNPVLQTGYEFSLSASNSSGNDMYLNRDSGGIQTILANGKTQFVLGEWIKVFVRRLPYGRIVAGYERMAGLPLRDSIIATDPHPLTAPGRFLLWACSDVAPYTYFDDACYSPICFDREADLNCDGVADVFDVIKSIEVIFSGGSVVPCAW